MIQIHNLPSAHKNKKLQEKECKFCGKTFSSANPRALYCSNSCKTKECLSSKDRRSQDIHEMNLEDFDENYLVYAGKMTDQWLSTLWKSRELDIYLSEINVKCPELKNLLWYDRQKNGMENHEIQTTNFVVTHHCDIVEENDPEIKEAIYKLKIIF